MASNIIAEIMLTQGEVGYYDDYSHLYLTARNPHAFIFASTDTTQIRRSVASGRLRLVSGSLDAKVEVNQVQTQTVKQNVEQPKVVEPKEVTKDGMQDKQGQEQEVQGQEQEVQGQEQGQEVLKATEPEPEKVQEPVAEEVKEDKEAETDETEVEADTKTSSKKNTKKNGRKNK